MSSSGWIAKNEQIAEALAHARERRLCLVAKTQLGLQLLERRVRTGELISPFPRVFEEPRYWQELSLTQKALRIIRSAAQLHPDWVFCSFSAAVAHGLEVSGIDPLRVHIATTTKAHLPSHGPVICHIVDDANVAKASGVRVVDLATCTRQCLCSLDLKHGLAVADSYLRKEQLVADDLQRVLALGKKRRRGIRQARQTAHYADPRAENGGESVARGAMIELGYAVPDLQVDVGNPADSQHPFRVDFLWRMDARAPIIGELDGMEKYQNPDMLQGRTAVQALSDERIRESRLSMTGASIVRFHFRDVLNPTGFSQLLDAAGVPRMG